MEKKHTSLVVSEYFSTAKYASDYTKDNQEAHIVSQGSLSTTFIHSIVEHFDEETAPKELLNKKYSKRQRKPPESSKTSTFQLFELFSLLCF